MRTDTHNRVDLPGIANYIRTAPLLSTLIPGLLSLALLLFASTVFAVGGDLIAPFPVRDGQTGKQEATASAIDSAGNIVVTGYQNLAGNTDDDYLTIKINADGSIAWRAIYNRSGGSDRAMAIAVDSGNNVIVTGYAWNGTNNDIHTIKYNGATGAVIWEDDFNGGGNDLATAVALDNANGLVYVAGYSQNGGGNDDYLVLKYANSMSGPANAPTKTITYNGTANGPDHAKAIAANTSGFAVTGESWNGADFDCLTIQYDLAGTKVREWRYSSAGVHPDAGRSVVLDGSGNIFVAALVTTDTDSDIYIAKYDASSGALLWQKTYNGGFNDIPVAIAIDSGDLYVAGITWTLAGHNDLYLARRQGATGDVVWEKIYNSNSADDDFPVSIVVSSTATGGVFVTGYAVTTVSDDILILKVKKDNGTILWQKRFNGTANKNDRPVGIGLDPSGNVCVAGWSDTWTSGTSDYDFLTIKYSYGPLNPPSDLMATASTNTSIHLSWADNSHNEDGFRVERKLGYDGTWVEIATTGAGVNVYNDTGLVAENYYYYQVRAYNAGDGNSSYSNDAHALTKVINYEAHTWAYLYNGLNNSEDYATAIAVGPDDHPVVTGYSNLEEEGVAGVFSNDYYTIKLDRDDKSVKWTARYDSSAGGMDRASAVAVLPDNDVIVSGNAYLSGSSGEDTDEIYTIKYQASTHNDPLNPPPQLWADQYGREGSDRAAAVAVASDSSGNSVVAGYGMNSSATPNDDIYIIKYNSDGTLAWPAAIYDGGKNDYPTSVAFDATGNIFITGYSENGSGNTDWFTAKYNGATGALVWSDTLDGAGHGNDYARSLAVDSAGNVYVTGSVTNSGSNIDYYTVKYDGANASSKRRIWEKSYNGPGNGTDKGMVVKVDPIDGAVIVAGSSLTGPGDHDFHLIRYHQADGTLLWERTFQQPGKDDYVTAMAIDSSGYIYVTGNSRNGPDSDPAFDASSDILALIYNHEGTSLKAVLYDGTGRQDEAEAIAVNYRGEAFIAGFSKNASGNADYVVLKLTNSYILVPAPLTVTPQADYSKINLAWRENTPGTSFHIWRTLGPATPTSDWGSPIYSGSSGTASFQDSGLSVGTNYCYRIEAYQGSLNSRFLESCASTTLPAPVLGAPQVTSTSQIDLSWSAIAGNSGYLIERKIEAGSWNTLTTTAAGATTYSDNDLTAGTLYTYRVSSLNASGASITSNESGATTIPDAPALNAISGIASDQLTLTWSDISGESSYKIERKEGMGGSWVQLGTTPAQNVVTLNDTGLTTNTQYYYRMRAYNAAGDSAYSGEQGALTLFTSPNFTSASGTSTTQIDLAWSDVSGETGYTIQESVCNYNNYLNYYDIAYCIPSYEWAWGGWSNLADVGANVTTYQRGSLTAGYAYRYRIIANVSGNSSAPSAVLYPWTNLSAPATFDIAPASETSLSLSWSDVAGETGYEVERKLGPGGTWAVVKGDVGAGTTAYDDTGLGLQTEYCYRIKSKSSYTGSSAYSAEKCAYTPLPAPTLNALSSPFTTQIDLSWNNITGNTGYEVRMRAFGVPDQPEAIGNEAWWGAWGSVATLGTNTTAYSQTSLTAGYTYQFQVRDLYSGGNSAWSTVQTLTTRPDVPTISGVGAASTTQLTITWNNVNGETIYKLEWKEGVGGTWSAPIDIGENATTYTHNGLTPDATYYYRIRALSSGGYSDYSAEKSQVTSLPTLNALSGITAAKIDLSWTNIPGNSYYTIERKVDAGAWSWLANTAQNAVSYADTGLTAGTLYSYRLMVANSMGTSAAGNEQSATTTPDKTTATVTVLSSAQVRISWPVVPGATNYKVEQKEGAGGSWSQIDNVAATYGSSYCGYSVPRIGCTSATPNTSTTTGSGLAENTQYCYQIKSWNATGLDSVPSDQVCVTTSALANENLLLSSLNSFKIKLEWSHIACSPNPCDSPEGFEIEKRVWNGAWVQLATVSAATMEYIDVVGIEPKKTYRYRVRSFSGADRSPYSEGTVTTPPYVQDDGTCQ